MYERAQRVLEAAPATSKVDHLRDNMQAGFGRLPDAKLRAELQKR